MLRASVAYSLTGLSGRAFPSLRRDARTNGARWCSAPPPVVAEPGRRVVCRCCERCLVSNRVLRVGVAYSLTGLSCLLANRIERVSRIERSLVSDGMPARTGRAGALLRPRYGRAWASRRRCCERLLRVERCLLSNRIGSVAYSLTGLSGRAF